jgi:hypothetical protein
MLRRVVWYKLTDVSEVFTASVIRDKKIHFDHKTGISGPLDNQGSMLDKDTAFSLSQQTTSRGLKWPQCEADHSLQCSAEVKNA